MKNSEAGNPQEEMKAIFSYEIIYDHAQRAISKEEDFKDLLLKDPRVTEHFTEADVDTLLDPEGYLGLSRKMTLDAVKLSRRQRKRDRVF